MKSTAFKPVFILALLACLASGAGAQAACTYFDDFQENGDGTVTDPRDGLVWQKCALGQEWTGSGCSGEATEMDWLQAMKAAKNDRQLGKKDWRLPTKDEMLAVVGDYEQCENQPAPERAASRSLAYPVRDDGFLGVFWSGSPNADYSNGAWHVYFNDGYAGSNHGKYNLDHVRLVRGGQSFGALEFAREYAKLGLYQREIEAKKRAAEKEEKLKAQQAEREAKAAAARRQMERAHACDNFYVGKYVQVKQRWMLGTATLDVEVTGVDKEHGMVSSKVVRDDTGSSLYVNDRAEMSCEDFKAQVQ